MAKQIITLGIGPIDNLTPFITTGLEIGALTLLTSGNIGNAVFIKRFERRVLKNRDERWTIIERIERRVFVKED